MKNEGKKFWTFGCLFFDNATNAILQPDSTTTDSLPRGRTFKPILPYFQII